MTIDVRALTHFFYLLDMSDEAIVARLENVSGDGIVNLKAVQGWTSIIGMNGCWSELLAVKSES
jgi:hypothetical protein